MRVKICGITRLQDAQRAAHLGAWALGFNFHRCSPRYVPPRIVRDIASAVKGVLKFGVFVNAGADEIEATCRLAGLTHVQLHGEEPPELAGRFGSRAIKVIRPKGIIDVDALGAFAGVGAFLVDAHVPGVRGGTGRVADWALAERAKRFGPVILAGGITADNVGEALRAVRPFAVDLCSGVEAEPGIKDAEKLETFFAAIRRSEGEPS